MVEEFRNAFARTLRSCMLALILVVSSTCANAAIVRVVNTQTLDGANNGSIDLDITMHNNIADDAVITCNIRLTGDIEAGDLNKLKSAISSFQDFSEPRLCLNSPGGSYAEALAIVDLLAEKTVGTALEPKAQCVSACAIIFMGGTAAWKGQLNRFMHTSSTLAFHSPNIAGANAHAADQQLISRAYAEGIKAVRRLIEIGRRRVPNFFPNELLEEMLIKGADELYAVDTVGKVIRYRIHLYGAVAPRFDERAFCNACANHFFGATETSAQGDGKVCVDNVALKPERHRFSSGIRFLFDGAAPRGGGCVIDVAQSGGRVTAWYLNTEPNYPPKNFAGVETLSFSYWYLYPANTMLHTLPTANSRAASQSVAPAAPASSEPRPQPKPVLVPATDKEVEWFIEHVYLPGAAKYNDQVDYYQKGVVPRAVVLEDQAKYQAKWPSRRYSLIPGTTRVTRREFDHYDVIFNFYYQVSGPQKTATGKGATYVQLRRVGDDFYVTAVREALQRN